MPAIKIEGKSIHRDLGSTELRELARKDERTTAYGSASYITRVRNRSARNTCVVGDGISLGVKQQPIADQEACRLIAQVNDFLKDRDIIQVDRTMGQHPGCNFACRLYVTKDFARLSTGFHVVQSSLPSNRGRTGPGECLCARVAGEKDNRQTPRGYNVHPWH